MDDNARPHRANLVDEFLESEDIKRIPWPANSPDLNPIENLWDYLGRAIARRHPPPRDVNGLKTALLEEWSLISQTVINNVISSLKTRCDMCEIGITQECGCVGFNGLDGRQGNRITQECGCVGFNGPDGRQGCVLTRTVESNQGGRLIVMNPWRILFQVVRSALKAGPQEFSGLFSLLRLPKKPSSQEANSLPEVTPQSLLSSQISTTLL
ncbi:transposable element Tcb2 transposase [Trichonephila clavipes]|nr:transposable element Tcb2 transposase [Trichonephila clavipes]